ncbi:MAG: DUF3892 domain-containing protein [Ornithinimicrobium sp.]|uniref:DUF3892 domain-containing protein n=1 Tax=Ornithinimicrobium sp. TaxID=1977084 RepID=UPI003D9B5735
MAFRTVTSAFTDSDGDITALAGNGDWSPRTSGDVVTDIVAGLHHYVAVVPGESPADIHVVRGSGGRFLRTTADTGEANNLDELPDALTTFLPEFLGDHPDDEQTNWSDNLQGVTHSADHWFFTQMTKLLKFASTTDLTQDSQAAVARADMPKSLGALDCDHFGDPDYLEWDGHGYIFVPVEGSGGVCGSQPVLAVFEDLGTEIAFVGSGPLPSQNALRGTARAGWCAFDPETLLLHSSHNEIGPGLPVFRYNVDLDGLAMGKVVVVPASDLILRIGRQRLTIPQYLQGGCFSPRGHLFLLSGKGGDHEGRGGIRVFDRDGSLLCRSSPRERPFLYEYHSGALEGGEEPEGLTFWDVDALPAGQRPPSVHGQLHAILLNNDFPDKDNFFFKHYAVAAGTL